MMGEPHGFWAAVRVRARDLELLAATVLIGTLILMAGVGPLVWTSDPSRIDLDAALQSPSWSHPMGTDGNGRDVLARFNAGARISLVVGALVVLAAAFLGGAIGLVAGLYRGAADTVLMRLLDAILAFPPLILAMAITVGLGVGFRTAALGTMVSAVPYFARLLRSDVLRLRSLEHVEAAVALGATPKRVIFRHILPHAASTMLIQAGAVFGYAILTLAALGFVGLGAQIPTPEWGAMITDGLQYALTGQWWIAFFPGVGLLAAVVSANMYADRARDILDPRGDFARI